MINCSFKRFEFSHMFDCDQIKKNLNGKKEIISYFNFAEIIIFVRLDGFLGSFF